MKAKKWVTFITFGISVIALICAIIADPFDNLMLMYDISMAIFGSALLGFIMSLTEYFAERKKAMEDFLIAANCVCAQLRKIKYIVMDEPKNLVLDCIFEEENNEQWKTCDEETAKALGLTTTHKKRDAYLAWIQENKTIFFTEKNDVEANLLQIYNQRIDHYNEIFGIQLDMYIAAATINLEDLSSSYSNLDFLFGNRTIRKTILESIYSKLLEYQGKIKSEAIHFNMLKDGKGSFSVCCSKILELNDFFFTAEEKQTEDQEWISVYQKKFDDVSDKIAEIRSKIYFQKDVRYGKKIPVFSKLRRGNESTD